ncbi:copper resistance CopC/CopD family protein [Kitasatospora mediocidica]|uniref:copper resistance CopC/CopD family protein n=1 Tax=Kitasatospora mediocidica TaxID=58352 RepID=UPI000561F5A3|nr:copper resistance protein CopC [Kitasatospora mediocidica]
MLVLLAAFGLVWAGPAQPAFAHAQVLGTSPANGAQLASAPSEIDMRFSEGVLLVDDGIQVVGPNGPVRPASSAQLDAQHPDQLHLALPAGLGSGIYTVNWRVVSADSHPVHGAFVFGVGGARPDRLPTAGAQGDGQSALSLTFDLFRWLGYAALGLLAGGAGFLAVCWPDGLTQRRVRRVLALAWGASLSATLGVLLLQGPYADGLGLTKVVSPHLVAVTLGTGYGHYVLARLVLLLAALVLGLALRGGPAWARPGSTGRRIAVGCGAALGVGLPLTWRGTGHTIAEPGLLPAAADALHLAAMACWFGGLVFLLLCLGRAAHRPPAERLAVAAGRFSLVATGSVAVLVVTGCYKAWREVGSVAALTGTAYGTLLVLKLGCTCVLLWLGMQSRGLVRRRLARSAAEAGVPVLEPVGAGAPVRGRTGQRAERARRELAAREALDRRQLRWSVGIEVVFVLVVLALTSVLVATPPGARPAAARSTSTGQRLALRGGGHLTLTLGPAGVGPNSLALTVLDPTGKPWDVPEVTAALSMPDAGVGRLPVTLVRTGAGNYQSQNLILPKSGTARLEITVRSTETDEETVQGEFTVF